jgi:hypothetical protein
MGTRGTSPEKTGWNVKHAQGKLYLYLKSVLNGWDKFIGKL